MPHDAPIDENLARREEALQFLFGRIDYERALAVPYGRREFKLDRMHELLDRLDNPQSHLPIIHVAGTKGKGSTTAMIAAVLSAAGYRTGTYTSPHLDRIEERMSLDGRPCEAEDFVSLIDRVRPAVEAMDRNVAGESPDEIGPTYFELTTAMALVHFARSKADAAVLEVGLGGRLDSTNVCRPTVSVITNISLDHTRQLGDSLASIAREKAGIIKSGVPVISGVVPDEPRRVIRAVCRERQCRLVELGVDFDFDYRPPRHLESEPTAGQLDFRLTSAKYDGPMVPRRNKDLALGLLGRHQAANAAVALATLAELERAGWRIPEESIRKGLAEARCPARVEVVARRPTVVVDSAHNRASIEALLEVLDESFSPRRRWLVFATTQEKDVRGMLEPLMAKFDEVVLTRYLTNPRAVPPEELAAISRELCPRPTTVCAEPADAWAAVVRQAGPEDLICITGSFFIAAEMRGQLAANP